MGGWVDMVAGEGMTAWWRRFDETVIKPFLHTHHARERSILDYDDATALALPDREEANSLRSHRSQRSAGSESAISHASHGGVRSRTNTAASAGALAVQGSGRSGMLRVDLNYSSQ